MMQYSDQNAYNNNEQGAVYQNTAPYSRANMQDEALVGFTDSPLIADIAKRFYENKDEIIQSYGGVNIRNLDEAEQSTEQIQYPPQNFMPVPQPQYQQQVQYNPYQQQPYYNPYYQQPQQQQYIPLGYSANPFQQQYQQQQTYYNPYQQQTQYNPYGQPYDPYLARNRYEENMRRQEQQWLEYQKVWMSVVNANRRFHGLEEYDMNENQYEIPQEYHPTISIMNGMGECVNVINKNPGNPEPVQYENGFNHMIRMHNDDMRRQRLLRVMQERDYQNNMIAQREEQLRQESENYTYKGNNESLFEFFNGSGKQRYIDMLEYNDRKNRHRVGTLYGRNQFDSVMEIYKINEEARRKKGVEISPGLVVNGLDDISITLPEHLRSNYQERRDEFMVAILGRNPNMHIPAHNLTPADYERARQQQQMNNNGGDS